MYKTDKTGIQWQQGGKHLYKSNYYFLNVTTPAMKNSVMEAAVIHH
jgi:hypothetical protein